MESEIQSVLKIIVFVIFLEQDVEGEKLFIKTIKILKSYASHISLPYGL